MVVLIAFSLFLGKKEFLVVQNPILMQERPMITYVEGEAFYQVRNSESWEILETGDKISPGTIIKTGPQGLVDIRLNAESRLRVLEDSLTSIDQVTIKNVRIDHRQGKLFAKFHRIFKDQNYQVTTPTTTAGIRGTELFFDVTDQRTKIYALSGITEIKNTLLGDPILLSYSSMTTVTKEGEPTLPVKIESEAENQMRKELNNIHDKQVLHISHTILFKPNSADMLPSSFSELESIKELLEENRVKVTIEGHTAHVGSHSAMYSLSLKRAETIRRELIQMGIKERRLYVAGFGSTKSVADNDTEVGRALNRRVEFIVVER